MLLRLYMGAFGGNLLFFHLNYKGCANLGALKY